MVDFCNVEMALKKNSYSVYPEFKVGGSSKDLMIRGKNFYAVWDEERGFWSTHEDDVQRMIDQEILQRVQEVKQEGIVATPLLLRNFSSGKWTEWQKYIRSLPDSYRELDKKMIFSNQEVRKEDYVTRKLSYPLTEQPTPAYDELMSVIYDPEERQKLEWAVGSIICGDSKELQKFIVLYGPPGSGKSTFLNILQKMFPGYYSLFNAKNLTGNKNFAMESLRTNSLFAIQHDGDLSRIEDNTLLNSIVSHEEMEMDEKYKSKYTIRPESFLFMGTNKPVRITDSKSGIIRRLIDVVPTGEKVPRARFDQLWNAIQFEFSGIAHRCLMVYKELGSKYYDNYVPLSMIGETNDIFNFIEDNYDLFQEETEEGLRLTVLWRRYKDYCEEANIQYPLTMRSFKVEMKEYFDIFNEREGHVYSIYHGFREWKFGHQKPIKEEVVDTEDWLTFEEQPSLLDREFAFCPAQYATQNEVPYKAWTEVKTKLNKIDTKKLHYLRVPEKLIVIDFDLKNEKGEKDFEKNLEAAMKWPPTYAELSRSGAGIHLHYFYEGDPTELSRIYGEDVEIKVFTGYSSLRRKLTKCNTIAIATISSGLPLKGVKKMVNGNIISSERILRARIAKNLRKEYHAHTKPSIDFIYKILEDAYNQGLKYDVRDMRPDVQQFALSSTHQVDYCLRMVGKMKWVSEEASKDEPADHSIPIVFFDVEVFPNLFVVCYTVQKSGIIKRMINPSSDMIEDLVKYRLVGFYNRNYDNHILYGRMMGYSNQQLYELSRRLVSGERGAGFREAYNLSYTDIYDFLSPQHKMGLKKWEIKLGIHHMENAIPWDQPVPEDRWNEIADYCCNDVFATECVWDANQEDWIAREILAEWSGLTVNDTTNSHSTKIVFGDESHPQRYFNYPDLSKIFPGYEYNQYGIEKERYNPGTKIVRGKSIYMGEDPSEGGYAWALPGTFLNVGLLDIVSMHPHTIGKLRLFGDFTDNFMNIVDARVAIKTGDLEDAKNFVPDRLHRYLNDPSKASGLAGALKGVINPVYGLTLASFDNKFRDPRNKDNVVAKYGALFMITLKHKVQEMGYTVVHIKTDSIKIANVDEKIISFCKDFAREYGFEFDHEATYDRMCIVNDAVYIAKYKEPKIDKKTGKEIWWTATGTQFQIPYVFKTLFSKEPIEFQDLCETKSVTSALYLDMNENLAEEEHNYRFIGKIGLFCPVKDGAGGGILLRQKDDGGFSSATGTKRPNGIPYRWMESDQVKKMGLEDQIDHSYYIHLVDEAIAEISKYCDFEWFVSDSVDRENIAWSADSDLKGLPDDKEEYLFMNPPVAA